MPKNDPWYMPGKWNLSSLPWRNEIRSELSLPKRFYVRDTGLRHQEDHPCIIVSIEDKLKMVEVLVELGVSEIECGWPAMVEEDYDLMKAITRAGLDIKKSAMVGVYADDVKKEMDVAVEAGADNFKIGNAPSNKWTELGYGRRPYKHGVNKEEALTRALIMIDYAKKYGLPISTGFVDIMRADLEWIKSALKKFPPGQLDRFFVYEDGLATPMTMRYLIMQLREILGETRILVHCHNTFGLATANVLAAVEAGAEWADLSVNGYGPEAGAAPLEEVVCALEMLYGVDTGIKLEKLYEASKVFEKITRVKCQPQKPIAGENVFLSKSGSAAAKILKSKGEWDPEVFPWEAFNPKLVGQSRSIVWESRAKTMEDSEALLLRLEGLGLKYSDEEFMKLKRKLADQIRLRGYITDDGIRRLILKYTSKS